MKLLKSQKNILFKIIENSDSLSPSQFEIVENKTNQGWNTSIKFKASDYYFGIFESTEYGRFLRQI